MKIVYLTQNKTHRKREREGGRGKEGRKGGRKDRQERVGLGVAMAMT